MVRERQTASNRRRKASEVTQTRKGKRVRCTDALPQEQPPHVEEVEADTEAEAEEELENQEQEVPSRDGPSSDVNVGDAENVPRGGPPYLLFVLGCTLFIDKSGTNVDVSLLSLLSDLEKVGTYAWGTGGLAYLCRQLGTASRRGVRQMCGFTTLLEAWIHEHFPTLQQLENPNYTEDLPRAHRWLPRREAGNVSVSHYRRMLDDLRADQVIFDPYKARRGDVPPIVFYTGPIRGMSIVEPYLPDRVLRQFGVVQVIPGDPIAPARVERGDKKYQVVYTWIDANWTSWEYHVVPEAKRVRTRADVPWECHPDYLEWLNRYSHCRVSPDAGAGEVNTGGNDGMKLAAIAAEVDKVYADKLSPFNMRQALRNISKILRRNTEGEPTTPFTTESYTRCH